MNGSEMASAPERVFLDSGHFDLSVLTPGSPAYVRRLRDQAALRILQAMYSNPEMDRFGFGGYVQPEDMAVKDANKLVAVLGYQVPEDAP